MKLTRRGYGVVGVAATLVLVGVLGDRPLALAGAGTTLAWVLVALYRASEQFVETDDRLTLDIEPDRGRILPDRETSMTLSVADPSASHPVSVSVEWPVGVDGEDRTVDLRPTRRDASAALSFSIPIAGEYDLPELTCEYRSADGLFRQTVPRAESVSVVVSPTPGDVHVGTGGDPIAGSFGRHESGQSGSGIDFVNIRRYIPGDSVSRIDWNATARLNEPHVREFESETTRQTRIFVDNRRDLWEGEEGETKADYLREVVLGIIDQIEESDDPVGMTVVDDGGMRTDTDFVASKQRYRDCRRLMNELSEPDTSGIREDRPTSVTASRARRTAARLSGRGDAFAATVRPYFETTDAYVKRLESEPMYEAVRTKSVTEGLRGWTILCTDDTHPQETRTAVRTAVKNGGYVTAFVTPSALFEPESDDDDRRAYDRLVDFEAFRRSLGAIPNVRAYEVAPERRLSAVLDAGRNE